MPDPLASILRAANKGRSSILASERQASLSALQDFGFLHKRNQKALGNILQVSEQRAKAGVVDKWLEKEAVPQFVTTVESDLRVFAQRLAPVVSFQQGRAVQIAEEAVRSVIAELNPAGHFPAGFAADGSPIASLLEKEAQRTAQAVEKRLLEEIQRGSRSRRIQQAFRAEMGGSLTHGLTVLRTETLNAYRNASRDVFRANPDRIKGWLWVCSFAHPCAACLAKAGSVHRANEPMHSHTNCACVQAPLPALVYDGLMGENETDGEEWLTQQDERTQALVLGSKAAVVAYRAGEVTLDDFLGLRRSKYGVSIEARSLIGARRAAQRRVQ